MSRCWIGEIFGRIDKGIMFQTPVTGLGSEESFLDRSKMTEERGRYSSPVRSMEG